MIDWKNTFPWFGLKYLEVFENIHYQSDVSFWNVIMANPMWSPPENVILSDLDWN